MIARVLMTILGIGLTALGIWLCLQWWDAVRALLLALAALVVVLIGLALLILGISELAGAARARRPDHP